MENNFSVDNEGRAPLQKLTGTDSPLLLRNQHTWGCPVYVLERKAQTSSKDLPKWKTRARIGFYLGRSPSHAGNVALALKPSSGHVSPQFHVFLMMTLRLFLPSDQMQCPQIGLS